MYNKNSSTFYVNIMKLGNAAIKPNISYPCYYTARWLMNKKATELR